MIKIRERLKLFREEEKTSYETSQVDQPFVESFHSNRTNMDGENDFFVNSNAIEKDSFKDRYDNDISYQSIANVHSDGLCILDLDGIIKSCNSSAVRLLGFAKQELIGRKIDELCKGDEGKRLTFHLRKLCNITQFKEIETLELELIKKNGTAFIAEITLALVKQKGKLIGFHSIIKDISYLKKLEKKVMESKEQVKSLFFDSPVSIIIYDIDTGGIIDANKTAFSRQGFLSVDGLKGSNLWLDPPYSFEELLAWIKKTSQEGPQLVEWLSQNKNGDLIWEQMHLTAVNLFGKQRVVATSIDITDRKNADEELHKLALFSNDYVDFPLDLNLYYDLAYKIKDFVPSGIVAINRIDENTIHLESILGLSNRKLAIINKLLGAQKIGKPIHDISDIAKEMLTKGSLDEVPNGVNGLFFNRLPQRVADFIQQIMHIKHIYSIGLRHEDHLFGNVIIVLTDDGIINKSAIETISHQAAIVLDKRNSWIQLQKAHKDIRFMNLELERKVQKRTERIQQLLKQKDEFINQLGHDLKNPLGPFVQLLPVLRKHVTDEKDKEIIDVLQRNSRYMQNLVKKTIELAKLNSSKMQFSFEIIDLSDLIDEVIEVNRSFFEENEMKVKNIVSMGMKVKVDPLHIQEVFTNLFNNAIKYTDGSGTVTIDAKPSDDGILVSITDTGIGISSDQLPNVFEEYYKADSSRHDFDSSGLGLPICKRIIERHGGRIWAESEGLGAGSRFYFTLPSTN